VKGTGRSQRPTVYDYFYIYIPCSFLRRSATSVKRERMKAGWGVVFWMDSEREGGGEGGRGGKKRRRRDPR